MNQITIEVPAITPSVNNYVRHTRSGRHYKTPQAEAFANFVALAAGEHRGRKVEAMVVDIVLFLGPKQRIDIDNAPKLCLDSLARAGVIRSDASINRLNVAKFRAGKPLTRITVWWEEE